MKSIQPSSRFCSRLAVSLTWRKVVRQMCPIWSHMMAHAVSQKRRISVVCAADKSKDLSYQVRYTEENHRCRETPWSVRQTGVYHHHSSTQSFDLFMLLHPLAESVLETQLIEFANTQSYQSELESICSNPYTLHILPFALYTGNWRWYFRSLGEDFDNKVKLSMSFESKHC